MIQPQPRQGTKNDAIDAWDLAEQLRTRSWTKRDSELVVKVRRMSLVKLRPTRCASQARPCIKRSSLRENMRSPIAPASGPRKKMKK